ncbi:MAG: lipopolysaccharide biosynthesis protein [Pseudarcicella sp.]|nr:lipopolysaccharide biosynthesis protein [Pseudarcicella sp.]MBP6411196.1 lipopolysaccharide biosynthesis protein [Pseudarcicella sp.]
MGIIIKQTLKSSFFAYWGILLGFFTTVILFPKVLSESQVGLVRLLNSLTVLLAQMATLGFNAAGSRFFPYFRDDTKQHNGYLFWGCIISLTGLAFTLGALAFNYHFVLDFLNTKSSPLLESHLFWVFPLTFFTVFFFIFDNYARVLYDAVAGTFLKEFLLRCFVLIVVLIYYFDCINFKEFVALYCIALSLPTLFIMLRVWQKGWFFFKPIKGFWTPKFRKDFISLSALTFLSGFSTQVVNYLDQIQVTSLMNLSANGIYSTMMMFGTVIFTPTIHVSRVGGAIISEAWKNNDLKNIESVYKKSCLNLLIIGSLLFTCIVCNLHNVFAFLPAYEAGKWVVIWIGLGKLFDMATGLNGLILQTSKYYYFDTVFMIFLIIGTWLMNQWLIPIYGITGSAMATASVILLFNIFRTLFVWAVFGMFPFSAKNIYALMIAILVFGLSSILPQIPNIGIIPSFLTDTIFRSLFTIILFISLVFFTNISEDFTFGINMVLGKIKNKLLKTK